MGRCNDHDLGQILAATAWAPTAWRQALAQDAPPYPFWWFIHTRVAYKVHEVGGPPISVEVQRSHHESLAPDLPRFLGASRYLYPAWRRIRTARRPSAEVAPGSILVHLPDRGWAGGRAPADNIHLGPVAARLQAEGEWVSFAWAAPENPSTVPGAVGWTGAFWGRSADNAFRETEGILRRRIRAASGPRDLGFSIPTASSAPFMGWLESQVPTMAIHAGHLVATARMLRAVRPRAVLLACEGEPLMRALVASARALGIPTISVQNCWISPTSPGYLFAPPAMARRAEVAAAMPDALAAYGPWFRRLLEEQGPWQERVTVTGAPRYDALPGMRPEGPRQALRRRAGWEPAAKVVAWMTQTHGVGPEESARNVAALARLLKAEAFRLVVKLHPAERPDHPYGRLVRLGALVLAGTEDPVETMAGADAVLVRHSTTAMEAALLGVPVVLLNLMADPRATMLADEGVGREAVAEGGLAAEIGSALSAGRRSPLRRASRAEPFLKNADGGATARVVALVRRVAS